MFPTTNKPAFLRAIQPLRTVFFMQKHSRRMGTSTVERVEDLLKHSNTLIRRPYTHCQTQIVDLKPLRLPDSASDEEYVNIYRQYVMRKGENAALLRDAVESVKHGIAPPVAFPTETVYGLGADATNAQSVAGIFAAKGRPNDNPLIVHAASASHLERLTGQPIPEIYRSLIEKFWPGPLTILVPAPEKGKFAKNVHPGQPTIGFRVPQSKYARFFIAATDRPIAGPSANSSGKPSPVTAQHVLDDLNGKINFILDGGPCDIGVESTVVDGLHNPPLILRPGGVSQQDLIAHGFEFNNKWKDTAIGYERHETCANLSKQYITDLNGAPRAPGMKYRHYAPRGKLILFSESAATDDAVHQKFKSLVSDNPTASLKIGVLSRCWPEFGGLYVSLCSVEPHDVLALKQSEYAACVKVGKYRAGTTEHILFNLHVGPSIDDLAHSLFGILRFFDDMQCDFIFAEAVSYKNSNQNHSFIDAVADRIDKAAAERIG